MNPTSYPSTLPKPASYVYTDAGRALTSGLPGAHAALSRSLEAVATAEVRFFFDPAQASAFLSWWDVSLLRGGCWFSCSWMTPRGSVSVARFLDEPRFQHAGNGAFYADVLTELRADTLPVYPKDPPPVDVTVVAQGGLNAGLSSAVGVLLTGFDPVARYLVTAPGGGAYNGWSAYSSDAAIPGRTWQHDVRVSGYTGFDVGDGPQTRGFGTGPGWPTPEAARLDYPPGIVTGYSSYKVWIADPNPPDDRGGMSLRFSLVRTPCTFYEEVLTTYPVFYSRFLATSGTREASANAFNPPEGLTYEGTVAINQGALIKGHGSARFPGNTAAGRLKCRWVNQTPQTSVEVVFKADASGQPTGIGGHLATKNVVYPSAAADFPFAFAYGADNKLRLVLSNGADFTPDLTLETPTALTPGLVYHAVAVYRANGLCEIWVNGQLVASQTIGFSISNTSSDWSIGGGIPNGAGTNQNSFSGLIAMGAVYLHALTSDRIQAHWASIEFV